MKQRSSRGFTLVELLVVVAIVGILAAVLAVAFGNAGETARSAKCKSNLSDLAKAFCQTTLRYGTSENYHYHYPGSQSSLIQHSSWSSDDATGCVYTEMPGWISWYDANQEYPLKSAEGFPQVSLSSQSDQERLYAITNGAVWSKVGEDYTKYVCPEFMKFAEKQGLKKIGWSYQCNSRFGYEQKEVMSLCSQGYGLEVGTLTRADRMLLFAEIQGLTLTNKDKGVATLPTVNISSGNGSEETDCSLRCKADGGNDCIGFNHRKDREIYGHVAFADGHVEEIVAPKNGSIEELTDYLCRGCDITFRDGRYTEIKDSDLQ